MVREVCEKATFRVSNGNLNLPKTYIPTYLCDSSDSSDSGDNSDSSDISDSSDSSDSGDSSDSSDNTLSHIFFLLLKIVTKLKNQIMTKLKNSSCDETQQI